MFQEAFDLIHEANGDKPFISNDQALQSLQNASRTYNPDLARGPVPNVDEIFSISEDQIRKMVVRLHEIESQPTGASISYPATAAVDLFWSAVLAQESQDEKNNEIIRKMLDKVIQWCEELDYQAAFFVASNYLESLETAPQGKITTEKKIRLKAQIDLANQLGKWSMDHADTPTQEGQITPREAAYLSGTEWNNLIENLAAAKLFDLAHFFSNFGVEMLLLAEKITLSEKDRSQLKSTRHALREAVTAKQMLSVFENNESEYRQDLDSIQQIPRRGDTSRISLLQFTLNILEGDEIYYLDSSHDVFQFFAFANYLVDFSDRRVVRILAARLNKDGGLEWDDEVEGIDIEKFNQFIDTWDGDPESSPLYQRRFIFFFSGPGPRDVEVYSRKELHFSLETKKRKPKLPSKLGPISLIKTIGSSNPSGAGRGGSGKPQAFSQNISPTMKGTLEIGDSIGNTALAPQIHLQDLPPAQNLLRIVTKKDLGVTTSTPVKPLGTASLTINRFRKTSPLGLFRRSPFTRGIWR